VLGVICSAWSDSVQQTMGLTHSIRVGKLQLMRVEDVIHAGGCPLLQGTMQNDQGLLGHARVHENVYPASKSLK